jgi:hypothetical protein
MSENDEVKPFHARSAASGQEAADAVAAVLKHAQERDKAAQQKTAPKKQPKWLLPLGVNLGVFAAYLLIWSPPWVVLNPIAPPVTAERIEVGSNGMYMALSAIESYRIAQGRLPQSLAEAGADKPGLEYTVQGTNYVLILPVGEEILQYNSAVQTVREWGAANAGNMSRRIGG